MSPLSLQQGNSKRDNRLSVWAETDVFLSGLIKSPQTAAGRTADEPMMEKDADQFRGKKLSGFYC